jgi:3-hydroxyacyl-[acyl-carrier-protein] dehydratase
VNIEEIMSYLPHRFPMLLLDRIIELVPGQKSVGLKNVTINDSFFQGHFADKPCMPGVLILEAMAQAAAVIVMREPQYEGMLPVLGGIDKAKFRRPVVPGDQLISTAEVMWFRSNIGRIHSTATVDNEIVASVDITFMLVQMSEFTLPRLSRQRAKTPQVELI